MTLPLDLDVALEPAVDHDVLVAGDLSHEPGLRRRSRSPARRPGGQGPGRALLRRRRAPACCRSSRKWPRTLPRRPAKSNKSRFPCSRGRIAPNPKCTSGPSQEGHLAIGVALLAVALAASSSLRGQQPPPPTPTPKPAPFDPKRPPARELETRLPDGFTLAAVGDLITTRPLAQTLPADPGFAAVVKILREADAAFGNFETTAFDLDRFTGHSYPGVDDWPLVALPGVAKDLRELGFDLVSRANNHAMDYGIEGMRETSRWLGRPASSMPASARTAGMPGPRATSRARPRASAWCRWPRPTELCGRAAGPRPRAGAPGNQRSAHDEDGRRHAPR